MNPASPSPASKELPLPSRAPTVRNNRLKPFVEDQTAPSKLYHMDEDDLIYQRYPSATSRQRVEIAKMIAAERADEARKASEKESRTKSTVNQTFHAHIARRRAGIDRIMAVNRVIMDKKLAAQKFEDADAHIAILEERKSDENEDSVKEKGSAATFLDSGAGSNFDENTTEPDSNVQAWNDDRQIRLEDVSLDPASHGTGIDYLTTGKRAGVNDKNSMVSTKGQDLAVDLITLEQAGLILMQMHLVDAKLVS